MVTARRLLMHHHMSCGMLGIPIEISGSHLGRCVGAYRYLSRCVGAYRHLRVVPPGQLTMCKPCGYVLPGAHKCHFAALMGSWYYICMYVSYVPVHATVCAMLSAGCFPVDLPFMVIAWTAKATFHRWWRQGIQSIFPVMVLRM